MILRTAHQAVQNDRLLYASISAVLEALASIDARIAKLDDEVNDFARRSEVAWRLMSVPSIGAVTALAFIAAIEDPKRSGRTRDIGAYLELTGKRYRSGETDIALSISKQGDGMDRHYLYEAANVLLRTVKKRFALRSWSLKLLKTHGPKKARVAVARKLAVLLSRVWKDGTHFEAIAA